MLNLDEPHEFFGRWWIPDNQEAANPGTLTFSPGESVKLGVSPMLEPKARFTFAFTYPQRAMFDEARGYVRSGECASLSALFMGSLQSRNAWTEQTYHVIGPVLLCDGFLVEQGHYWVRSSFELTELIGWLPNDPVSFGESDELGRVSTVSLDPECIPQLFFDLPAFELRFQAQTECSWVTRRSVTESIQYLFTIFSKERSNAKAHIHIATTLRDFFAILLMQPVYVRHHRGFAPTVDTEFGKREPKADFLYFQELDLDYSQGKNREQHATTFDDVKSEIQSVVELGFTTWMKNGFGRLAHALLEHKTYHARHTFSDFVSLIIELEGYHQDLFPVADAHKEAYKRAVRVWWRQCRTLLTDQLQTKIIGLIGRGYEPSFRQRLEQLLEVIPKNCREFLFPDQAEYIEAIMDYRNKYAHGRQFSLGDEDHLVFSKWYKLTVLFIWILTLGHLGFSDDVINCAVRRNLRGRNIHLWDALGMNREF